MKTCIKIDEWGQATVSMDIGPQRIKNILSRIESGELLPSSRIWDFDSRVWTSIETWVGNHLMHWGVGPEGLTVYHQVDQEPLDGTSPYRWTLDDQLVVAQLIRDILKLTEEKVA